MMKLTWKRKDDSFQEVNEGIKESTKGIVEKN
jgi:hypothetical protein